MTLDQFFDKYPEAWITIYRLKKQWYAELYPGEFSEPIVEATGQNQQVALGNLAAKLLHWKEPQGEA